MRRFIILNFILIALIYQVTNAQSLPLTKRLEWDPVVNADEYEARMDGNLVGITIDSYIPITITALGNHTLTVVARNQWGDSDPGTLTINVSKAGKPGNIRIK